MSFYLTVFFEDPFWVGLFTLSDGQSARYCRVVFGSEPSDIEIYSYLQRHFISLKFSESLPVIQEDTPLKKPKRRQREAGKKLRDNYGVKKSYETIKQSIQQSQKDSRKETCRRREAEHEDYKLQIKIAKRKEKHKGH